MGCRYKNDDTAFDFQKLCCQHIWSYSAFAIFVRRLSLVGICALLIPVMSACGGLSAVRGSATPDQSYDASVAEVVSLAREAVVISGLKVVADEMIQGGGAIISASRGVTLWSYGENVRVSVEPLGDRRSIVRITSQAKVATNFTAKNFSGEIHTYIRNRIQSLPQP